MVEHVFGRNKFSGKLDLLDKNLDPLCNWDSHELADAS